MNFTYMMLRMLTSSYNRSDIKQLEQGGQPKTNIGKLLSLAGWGFDVINDNANKVMIWDDIDYAEGKVLDRYGENYGVYRGTAPDRIYRVMIKVKVMAMLSAGNLDTIIDASAILFDVTNTRVEADEVFPAKVFLYIEEEDLDELHKELSGVIASLMLRIKAAGVGMRVFRRAYYHAREPVYAGGMAEKFIRKGLGPYAEDKKITYKNPVHIGAGTVMYVKKTYMPSVYIFSEEDEKLEVTTGEGAAVAAV